MSDDYADLDEDELSGDSLTASGIAEYIRFNCCPRFFKLKFEGKEIKKRVWPEAFKPIAPLLYGVGKALEEKKVAELKEKAADYLDFNRYDPHKFGWEKATDSMNRLRYVIENQISADEKTDTRPILLYQVPMKGQIGVWEVKGISDLIAVWPQKDGKVKVRIFELKSSWKEQTAHRIQVAIYVLLLKRELGALSAKVELEGGVINRETALQSLDPDCLPKFKLSPLTQDVERLLAKNGELNRIHHTPLEKVEYQLCWRCDNCGFNECCIVCAVENESIAMLNLSRGEQKTLAHHGIERLEDLAKLKVAADSVNLRPYDFQTIPARDSQKVQELSTDPVVGAKLDWLVERAQYMLGGIRPSPYASRTRWMPWLTGTGYGSLPEDSATMETEMPLGQQPDGMIRIYFFVEWDYMLDVISLISARVSCTRFRGEPPSVSHVIASLPDDRDLCLEEERKLMEAFFSDLTKAITEVASQIGCPDEAPIHLYFFSRRERDALMKTVCRQQSLMSAHAVRDLLGLRQAIDQPMFSILQEEVSHRKALRYHSAGLLPILEQATYFDRKNWTVKRKDGTSVDLSLVFRDGLFNYALPYHRKPDGSIAFLGKEPQPKDGYYPARARFSDQLPIEYIWAVKERLERFSDVKGQSKVLMEKRKWCDYPQRTRRITDEELNLMGKRICLALEAIERSLTIRNRRLGKKPIPIPKISEFTLGAATLERSCREFLDLEYFSKRQEMYQHYALLPYQRVASGRSLIFQCTGVSESEKEFIVRGKLIYEGIGLPKAECVANACRIKGSDDSSSGDWMVVTELRRNEQGQFGEPQKRSPSEVEKSARAIVRKVDVRKLEVTVEVVKWPSGKGRRYSAWHNLPTTDPEKAQGKYMQLFEAGRFYILDELADDIISDRAAKCLDYAGNNVLYNLLADYLAGKTERSAHLPIPKEGAAQFLRWVSGRDLSPKPEQARFVERVFDEETVVMLQGPPGTGKTETLQLAVLAHVAAHRARGRCRVLMVAPTHKAIQEFVTKLARCWQEYGQKGGKDLKDLQIFRVLSSDVSTVAPIEGVTFINYNEDEATVKELNDYLKNQSTLTNDLLGKCPLILCVTPPGLYGLMKKIGGQEPPWGEGFFDLLVIDEASMMRVPELILSGSFLSKNSQILVAGDHRQLPPIMAHNWEKEDRRTLEEMASFLSAMDFLRLLRNEDLGLERIKCEHPANIPAERLCESHRCHAVIADFLREWVYEKDNIDFRSDQKKTLPPSTPKTDGLAVALKPENVFALIVHDEMESFQSNLVEASIVKALVENNLAESVGIITPHNAQKGLLKNLLQNGSGNTRVDTVERYQGGEADFIIISSTVSDPDYVRTESEFLLNLNRINVAISRMKKKLVVVASRSIFEFMPGDARDYDRALLWRGISHTVGFTADSTPVWQGALSDFLGQPAAQVNVEVYAKSEK